MLFVDNMWLFGVLVGYIVFLIEDECWFGVGFCYFDGDWVKLFFVDVCNDDYFEDFWSSCVEVFVCFVV